ncbi:beta-N-acetylhexosaminidase [Georgenia alba]|uniref:Beta-N-acetylhexosaminidase n=1 Tax=Georgenia alba TaxID=2233858 RepID=A0ABW2Q9P1_9MICO
MTAAEEPVTALVDRCFLVGVPGTTAEATPAAFRDWLAAGLGGVVLFGENVEDSQQLARLCSELREIGDDVVLAVDEEGGDVTRLHARDGSPTPGNLALGALDDVALTRSTARSIGAELRATGITLDLAPAVDVTTRAENPVIGTRSFGADPQLVARHGVAYLEGMQAAGVAACAKHFPGHGDTTVDSHLDLPVVDGDLEPHLVPFRAVVDAGVDAVMCAHISYPALDEEPASLSRRILTDLLRGELGFRGAVVTDSLTMAAVAGRVGLAEGCVRALAAGADLLCMNSPLAQQLAARDHVVAAVRDGRLPVERVREAASRVRALARPRPVTEAAGPPVEFTGELGRRTLHVDLADGLPAGLPYVIEAVPPRAGVEPSAASLLHAMQALDPAVDGARLVSGGPALTAALEAARSRPLVLVVRDAHRDPAQRDLLDTVRAHRHDAVVVGTGTTADAHLAAGRYVGARSAAAVSLLAVAELLLARR